MSNYTLREGSTNLFKNDRKESDTHPDFKGEILIDGKPYWVSLWEKRGGKGPYKGLSVKLKQLKPQADLEGDGVPF